jgi:hypothetical protein
MEKGIFVFSLNTANNREKAGASTSYIKITQLEVASAESKQKQEKNGGKFYRQKKNQ